MYFFSFRPFLKCFGVKVERLYLNGVFPFCCSSDSAIPRACGHLNQALESAGGMRSSMKSFLDLQRANVRFVRHRERKTSVL